MHESVLAKSSRRTLIFGTSLFLTMWLTGCASGMTANIKQYLEPCPIAYLGKTEKGTVGRLVEIAEEREHALIQCNTDKEAIKTATQPRRWWQRGP
jgi:hypothetical protein